MGFWGRCVFFFLAPFFFPSFFLLIGDDIHCLFALRVRCVFFAFSPVPVSLNSTSPIRPCFTVL